MNHFDPVTGEPLTPEGKAMRAAQEAAKKTAQGEGNVPQPQQPVYQQPVYQQPVMNEEDLLKVSPTPAKAAKKPSKGLLIGLIAGCAVVLIAAVVLLISSLAGSPVKKLANGARNTAKSLTATPMVSTVTQVAKGGSATLSLDLSKADELMQLLTHSSAKLDAQADLALYFTEGGAALSLDAKLDGKALADALITATKEDLAVSSTALFSKTNYGIDLKNLSKNLKGSIFDPDQDTRYALPQELFDTLTGDSASSVISEVEGLAKDGQKIAENIIKELLDSVSKNAKVTKGSEKITIADQEISTSTVTIELDGKAISAIASDMVEYLRKDKALKTFLNDVADKLENGALAKYADIDEDFVEDFYDRLDTLKDSVSDLEDELEDEDFSLTITGFLKGKMLLQCELEEKIKGDKGTIRLTVGPDPANPEEITFYMKDPNGDKTSATYKVSVNDKNAYEATFTVKQDSDTPLKAKIAWDKKEGTLRVSVDYATYWDEQSVELRANMTQSGKKTVIEPTKLTANGNSLSLKGITLTLDSGAKFPSISKYTNILTLSEDDMDDLITDLQKALQEIVQSAAGSAGGSSFGY